MELNIKNFSLSLRSLKSAIFLLPYISMIFVGLMMPSDGNHGILAPKSLFFILSGTFFLFYLFAKQKVTNYQLKILAISGSMIGFLLVWLVLGLREDPLITSSIDQFKIFLITISFVVMTLYLVSEKLLKPETIIRTMIFANLTYSFLKLSLIALHLLGWINLFDLMEKIDMRFMSMEMVAGLSRFQTSVDIVTPFFIFFVLQSSRLKLNFSKKFIWFYCFVSAVSLLFSFSRFLMAVGVVSGLLYWLSLPLKKLMKGLLLILLLSFIFIFLIGFENFFELIQKRFFSSDNYYSDLTRKEQIDALMNQFYGAPYLGSGLGAYVKDFIRDGSLTYSYEVQWVAFLMQFGLFGMIFLLAPLCLIAGQFFISFSRVNLSFFVLFMIWLFSGFTNPFLISLASGIIYSIFLLASQILNEPKFYLVKKNIDNKLLISI